MKPKAISAEEFDRRFDEGEDMTDHVDWSTAHRPGREMQRVTRPARKGRGRKSVTVT